MVMPDLSKLADLAKEMEDAYSQGTDAMSQAGKEVAKDMKPDHRIDLDIQLDAKIEGHDYKVDAEVIFDIELDSVLQVSGSGKGDLSKALEGLDVDLGDDKDAVMEQLGQPRAVGVVKKINTKELVLNNKEGKVKADLNKDGTLLATIKGKKILINCEAVFSFPKNTDVFVAIPSMEKMQKNMIVDLDDLDKPVKFSWTEKDKDNLKVSGTIKITKI